MLYYLSKNHTDLYPDEPLPYQTFKVSLENLLRDTRTQIHYVKSARSSDLIELDFDLINNRRNDLLGKYIEYIDPTKIVNNVLTDRPLLHTPRIKGLKKSIGKYGVLTPILVHTVPEWLGWWGRHSPRFNRYPKFPYEDGCYIVKEGRHRALVTELIGYKELIPSFVLIPVKGS